MLSRVADSLFWMSRYLERAENTVRLLDVNLGLMLDRSSTSDEGRWLRMISVMGSPRGLSWCGDSNKMADSVVFEPTNRASVIACIAASRENARQVRDEISSEQWQRLNRLYHQVHEREAREQFAANQSDFLSSVVDGIHLFKGVTDTTMSHGEGWQFIRLGRYLERAHTIATLLAVYQKDILAEATDREPGGYKYIELIGLLRSCTAFEAYCQVYTADLTPQRILEFLLLNQEFPHTLRYSIDALHSALTAIEQDGRQRATHALNSAAGRLKAKLSFTTIDEIMAGDTTAFLHDVQEECTHIHELIYSLYVQYSIQAALAI